MLYRFTFPIADYYDQEVFFQSIYIQAEKCPTHEQVVGVLAKANADDVKTAIQHPEWGPFMYCHAACLEVVSQIENGGRIPFLTDGMIETNVFCDTKFGREPISVTLIQPFSV